MQNTLTPPVGAMQSTYSVDDAWRSVLADAETRGLVDADAAVRAGLYGALGMAPPEGWQGEVVRCLAEGTSAERSLDAIAPAFDPSDAVELRALDPHGKTPAASLCGRLDDPADRHQLAAFIWQHNGRHNLYVGCNPRRAELAGTSQSGRAGDVEARRNVVLDFDFHAAPANDPKWERTIAELQRHDPLMRVATGNGVQLWFAVSDETADVDTSAIRTAMSRVGADDLSDLPRIVRLPFTVNIPGETKLKRGAVPRLAVPIGVGPRMPPRAVASLCEAMEHVAETVRLPGKGTALVSSLSRVSVTGEEKTPHPAPSTELLCMAVDALPNDAGHFDARDSFVSLCHAIRGAALAGGFETEGRVIWLSFCERWSGPADPVHDAQVWDGCRHPHMGWGSLMRVLERTNPAGHARVKAACAVAAFTRASRIVPVSQFNPAQIPPRQWVYGRSVIRGFVSVLVAPGGAGKSALMMVEAVAMVTGRELLPGDRPVQPLCVWLHNAEDPANEQLRRLAAVMAHHNVTHADLGNRLILTSGRDLPLRLARMGKDGPELVPGAVEFLSETALANKVDVLVLDPLGAMHSLPENSNEAMNLLAGALREIADRTGAAIVLLHHTSKAAASDMDAAGAGASRGASAMTDAARVVRQIVRMTSQEAARLGVAEDQRRNFLRVENGKANLAPAEAARWLRMVPVSLGNGTNEYPHGDEVAAVERWTPPSAVPGTEIELARVQAAIAAAATPPRLDPRSAEWAGWLVARELGIDAGEGLETKDRTPAQAAIYARVKGMVARWMNDGRLVDYEERDPKSRKPVKAVRVGTPAILSPGTGAE